MKPLCRLVLTLALALAWLAPAVWPVHADTVILNVTTTLDSPFFDCQPGNPCSLRAAIHRVNNEPGNVFVVHLQAGETYTLDLTGSREDANNTGDLDILRGVTIEGHGAIIDGNDSDRVLDLHGGTINLYNLTIKNGHAPEGADPRLGGNSTGEHGGGIQVRPPVTRLTLQDCVVENNRAGNGGTATLSSPPQNGLSGGTGGSGGGIYALNPDLRLTNTVVRFNTAGNGGTGAPGGTLTAEGGRPGFNGGLGGFGGSGGGLAARGYVELRASEISYNSGGMGGWGGTGGDGEWGARNDYGEGYPGGKGGEGGPGGPGGLAGGIFAFGESGNIFLFTSLVAGNMAGLGGYGGNGGSGGQGGQGTPWGENGSGGDGGRGGAGGAGGGIFNTRALNLYNSTVSNNVAPRGAVGGDGGVGGQGAEDGQPGPSSAALGGEGGGLYHNGHETSTTIQFSTIIGNTANKGGGIYANKTLQMKASVVDSSAVYIAGIDCYTLPMTTQITSHGYNLVSNLSDCNLTKVSPETAADLTGISANLGFLRPISGDVYGHPPGPTSPVVDFASCLDIYDADNTGDQVGDHSRPSGVRCDSGAVEYQWAAAVYLPALAR